jgi:hypothetical protein
VADLEERKARDAREREEHPPEATEIVAALS